MNCRLTPASQRSPFHATTVNMAGMLLCVFTTLAVLLNVSRDQSGATVAEVTTAFNGALRDHGRKDVAMIAASFRRTAVAPIDSRADRSRGIVNAHGVSLRNDQSLAAYEDDEAGLFSGEKLRLTDVNGPVFSHLVTELQRYCKVSPAEEFGGQLALDLHSQIPLSEDFLRSAFERLLKTCRKPNNSARPLPAEFEVIVWASTPATDALAAASLEAFDLEQSFEKALRTDSDATTTISSSGRIWTRPNSPRPVATVIVRAAKRLGPRN